MKSTTEYLTFNLPTKMGFVNITPQVEEVVKRSGVAEGIVLCNAMHITASVFINDDEPGLHHDYGVWLEKLAPFNPDPKAWVTFGERTHEEMMIGFFTSARVEENADPDNENARDLLEREKNKEGAE